MPGDSPTIIEFLRLHVVLPLRVCWADAQWVEPQLAHIIVIEELIEIVAPGRRPANADAPSLGQGNSKEKGLPKYPAFGLDLLKVVDSRTCSSTKPCAAVLSHYQ